VEFHIRIFATYSLLSNHPALKAVSPQACISDFFFDDFHHNGAYLLSYWRTLFLDLKKLRELPKIGLNLQIWYKDDYQFFLNAGPLQIWTNIMV
jgi:predicted acyl esterase